MNCTSLVSKLENRKTQNCLIYLKPIHISDFKMAKGKGAAESLEKLDSDITNLLQYVCQESTTGKISEIKHINESLAAIQKQHKNRTNNKNNDDYEVPEISVAQRLEYLQNLFKSYSSSVQNIDKIELIEQFGGYGLKKVADANSENKSKTDLRVPKKLMLLANLDDESDFSEFLKKDKMTSGMQNVKLALRLLFERMQSDKSVHHDYINSLPRKYNTPLYWSNSDFEELAKTGECGGEEYLAGYNLLRACTRQYCYFLNVFATIPNLRKFYSSLSWDAYRWAVSTVQTRANLIEDELLGFIPIIDLANTSVSSEIGIDRLFDNEETTHACLDLTRFNTGDDMLISYGKMERSCINMLIHNGLVLVEKLDFTLTVPAFKKIGDKKMAYMRKIGGANFDENAVLSPQVRVQMDQDNSKFTYALIQMQNFLSLMLDKNEDKEEYDYEDDTLQESAKKFLTIRLLVLNKQISGANVENFENPCLKPYIEAKKEVLMRLIKCCKDL